jgi:hypothetical protein
MLTLQDAKEHLRVDDYCEDVLIARLIDAATASVGDYINATEPLDDTAPAPVKAAALLLVGALYEQRESQGDRPYNKNPTFEALLNPYRVHS